ncbi:MAG: zinc-finger domain-containing protein [Robiginitomaculum sp.]|nr:zinc-finger domain-containing protein [Robiginitomaculum sp.]
MTKNATTIREPETVMVNTHSVSCDGGGGADGHPKVFMDMGQADEVSCKYCGKRFAIKS